jgi:hypothetical protein
MPEHMTHMTGGLLRRARKQWGRGEVRRSALTPHALHQPPRPAPIHPAPPPRPTRAPRKARLRSGPRLPLRHDARKSLQPSNPRTLEPAAHAIQPFSGLEVARPPDRTGPAAARECS